MLKIIFAGSILLISGCAGTLAEKDYLTPEITATTANTDFKHSTLEPKILYLLLTADLAAQKGRLKIAADGYLRVAKLLNDVYIAAKATKVALFIKDYNRAKEAVDLWLLNDANNLTPRKIAIIIALIKGEKALAYAHLNFLMNLNNADFTAIILEIANNLEHEGGNEVFFTVLEDLALKHPERASIFLVQSLLAMRNEKPQLALSKVQKALKLQPDWRKAWITQTQILTSLGATEKAERLLREAILKRPDNTYLKFMLAQVLSKKSKYEQAASVLQQALKQEPDNLENQYSLALLYLRLQKQNAAKNIFLDLLPDSSWNAKASLQLGYLEAAIANYQQAHIWFAKIKQGPYVFTAKMSTARLLLEQKKYLELEQYLKQLVGVNPTQQMRLALLKTELWSKQKRYQEAYDLLTTTLQAIPKQKDLLYMRALIAEQLDRLDLLENDLQTILQSYPDDVSSLNALGYTLANRNIRLDEAEAYLTKAIDIEPNNPTIIDSLGWLLFRQGQHEEALYYLQKAYVQRQEPEIGGHLVEVLWALNRKNEARELYHQVLKKFKQQEYILHLQRKLKGLTEH